MSPKCAYCGFASGTSKQGYFLPFSRSEEEVLKAAQSIQEAGIKRVSLSAGYGNYHLVLKALETIKENTQLKVLINIGADLDRRRIRELKSAGVDTICCNLETVNENLFKKLKPSDSFKKRLSVCYMTKEENVELSSGLLVGIGESEKDRARHIEILKDIEPEEVPVMGFRPYVGTPMQKAPPAPIKLQLGVIRIVKQFLKPLRITVPFPTLGLENIVLAVFSGANNIATVIPDKYPLKVKGVGSPEVGILSQVLEQLKKCKIETNVSKSF